MTYNFDPDEWYDRELEHLRSRQRQGELQDHQLSAAIEDLDRRYEEMLDRLDGTYTLPNKSR